ncbi:MAG: Ig-like domain-containing protein, partial [Bacteroidales bacterium]|nr:Ig-like domain-containing protein [Bacteroidales bacterium]
WSILNGTGEATISATGLVTAASEGTATATATATDGSGIAGTLLITIASQPKLVTDITVIGTGGATTITTNDGTLQLAAAIEPADASNKTVIWSIANGTGQASINTTGLVTAISNGTVTATATATDGSGVKGSLVITISGQVVLVTGITVTGAGGAATITAKSGTLQLAASVLPSNSTNKTVTWSIQNGTGQASISATGLVTAVADGTATATATATDGSGVKGNLLITISGQTILVTGITVTGTGGAATITVKSGTLQLAAAVSPSNATNKAVTWSIQNGTGQASINSSGLVTAVSDGTAIATATATDGSGIKGNLVITISGQIILVTGITVTGAGSATTITTPGGSLQLAAAVLPADATNKNVTWSIQNATGQASISSTGLVTAISDGTATATATAADGSGIKGNFVITISTGTTVVVSAIVVYGTDFTTIIPSIGGTLQLHASVIPQNAVEKSVNWSVQNVTGKANITPDGLLTAVSYGEVNVIAKAKDGSGVTGTLRIKISNHLPNDIGQYKEKPFLISNYNSTLTILFKPQHSYKQIKLFSLTGNLISNRDIRSNPFFEDISLLLPGIYILQLSDNSGKVETVKFFRQ